MLTSLLLTCCRLAQQPEAHKQTWQLRQQTYCTIQLLTKKNLCLKQTFFPGALCCFLFHSVPLTSLLYALGHTRTGVCSRHFASVHSVFIWLASKYRKCPSVGRCSVSRRSFTIAELITRRLLLTTQQARLSCALGICVASSRYS